MGNGVVCKYRVELSKRQVGGSYGPQLRVMSGRDTWPALHEMLTNSGSEVSGADICAAGVSCSNLNFIRFVAVAGLAWSLGSSAWIGTVTTGVEHSFVDETSTWWRWPNQYPNPIPAANITADLDIVLLQSDNGNWSSPVDFLGGTSGD